MPPLALALLLSLAASASAPRQTDARRQAETVAETLSPEAEIQCRILAEELRDAGETYVGLSRKDGSVVDLPEPLFRRIVAVRPRLRKASEFAARPPSGPFTLLTVSGVVWRGRNKATAIANYYRLLQFRLRERGSGHNKGKTKPGPLFSVAGYSGWNYIATRTRSGWQVAATGPGCGYWDRINVCGTAFVAYGGASVENSARLRVVKSAR